MLGERLSELVTSDQYKLAASAVLLSPFVPLLFMGDEYGETAPFQYFVSHSDPDLIQAVRKGRKAEFAAFNWQGEPPDPQDDKTFQRSKLNHSLKSQPPHKALLAFHKELIRLRKSLPALSSLSKDRMDVVSLGEERVLLVRRWTGSNEVIAIFNFSDRVVRGLQNLPRGIWNKRLDSSDDRWMGPGTTSPDVVQAPLETPLTLQPYGVLLFEKGTED
jgi:maltooligosyltrehalose trehalohydrolase